MLMDAIQLSIFANRIDAVCEEMGVVLQKSAFSPNIRDRLDYSCAVFDAVGELCAQAAHIPVHLGSMAFAMKQIVATHDWQPGDMLILNDPYMGGTHLPDVTLVAPVYFDDKLMGFVANRAHHADIGAETPGSMPLSTCLQDEGLVISPTQLMKAWQLDTKRLAEMMAVMRNPAQSQGDFSAQIAANRCGHDRLQELITSLGADYYVAALDSLNHYAQQLALSVYKDLPNGEYHFSDMLDDDGLGREDIVINACIRLCDGRVEVDFTGSAEQVEGNVNCPLSVTAAAVFYVFRCLLPAQAPACAGTFRPITLVVPKGSFLNAQYPAAVAAGNVETSTRIVDVVLGALAQVLPGRIPAASHGSMNNLAMGSTGDDQQAAWDYYETIGGGMGANLHSDGLSAVQTHMTNTLNTPVESLEMNFPLKVKRYQIRNQSGGEGLHKGGDGLVREYEFIYPTQLTLLTERRRHAPWGMAGASPGLRGENYLNDKKLPGKTSMMAQAGDCLIICTPGGGGYGVPKNQLQSAIKKSATGTTQSTTKHLK